jgi:hypothetical protein
MTGGGHFISGPPPADPTSLSEFEAQALIVCIAFASMPAAML